jgi:predicted amidohydrolase
MDEASRLPSVKATSIVQGRGRCIILPGRLDRRSHIIASASFDPLKRKNQVSFARK